ncbi:MAG TPA: hypothetical protein VN282_09430 [Pyrinomonadaceae bacterium]|nr:hypothetical protein [Pyrinomonadaceae bacterium]
MRLTTLTLLLCALPSALACGARGDTQNAKATPTPAATPAPVARIPESRTCTLLTGEELKEVQGEEPVSAQGSEHAAGPLSMSQCFYRLPTFAKSINLEVVSAAQGADAAALKEYWRKHFHPNAVEERELKRRREEEARLLREEELKREREAGQVREGGRRKKNREEEHWRPQRVAGVGEEAYWSGNQKMWTLAVLRRERVVRVTLVGGPDVQAENLKRAKALAAKALKRL